MSKGIETTFKGVTYRSRLEATWAAFFTNIGWKFEYEPFDGNGYIPDFLIIGERPMLVEIKPIVTEHQAFEHQEKIKRGIADLDYEVVVLGASPVMHSERQQKNDGLTYSDAGYGLASIYDPDEWTYCQWGMCGTCKSYILYADEGWWDGIPCGHRARSWDVLPDELILPYWYECKQLTRWQPGTRK